LLACGDLPVAAFLLELRRMSTRDSGVIDLFAVHKEEAERLSAATSAPPPAVSFDTGADDDDLDALAVSQRSLRKRAKIVGGGIGALAILGILALAMSSGGEKESAKATAAVAPPPPVVTAPPVAEPPPAATPAPAPEPSAPPTAKAKPDYTPATAAAAYAASHGKKKAPARKAKTGGMKLQKVHSAGTGG
jgi:hypothetical protein